MLRYDDLGPVYMLVIHADSIFWTVLVNKTHYYPFMMVGVAKTIMNGSLPILKCFSTFSSKQRF